MINKFSASVRRNQKQWMVVITILAVFAFLFDDLARTSQAGAGGNVIFLAVLCAGGMAILGYRRGQTTEFAVTGLVVGALVAFISMKASGPPVIVKTNVGSYTRSDLNVFRSKRLKVDHFLTAVAKATANDRGIPRFGSVDDGSMVSFALLQREARRMGVSLKDDSVNHFLAKATQGKLSEKDYKAALREAGLSEGELFDSVRQELEVQMVAQLISAPAEAHPTMAQFTRGAYSGRIAQQTPEQLWRSFQKLHVRQALSAVAVPIAEFAKLVPDPSEGDLRDFFEKHKNSFADERGTPGFLEPPKVQLAYLVASNLEAYEKQVPEITDQDVADHYLANKESYRVFDIPEPSSKLPDLNPNASSNSPSGSAPADATKTDNTPDENTAPPATDAKSEDKPAEPKLPDATEQRKDVPAEKTPAKKEGDSKEGTPCDDAVEEPKAAPTTAAAAAKSDADGAKTDEAKPADAPAKPEVQGADEKKAADKSPPAPALPSDDNPTATDPAVKLPSLDSLPMPALAARYRELDDDLKEQIRETVRTQKALVKMSEVSDGALEMMMDLSLGYQSLEPKARDQAAAEFSTQLKEYAEKHGLEYKETKEMSQLEMMTSLDERVGSATDPVSASGASRSRTSVAEEVFQMEGSGRGYRLSKFSPRRADIERGARYTFWKTAEIPAKAPDFKDVLVHKKVLEAWKFEKARPLAEKRANELVALIKKGEADIAAALSGQTINGTNDSPAASIRETTKFSWLRLPQSLPQFGLQQPTESTIDGIGQPGYQFMKAIFDDMANGDVSVVSTASRNAFYVVRVHDRDGIASEAEGVTTLADLQKQFLREQFSTNFLPTPYEFIGAEIQAIVDNRWRAGFRQRFGIEFESNTALVSEEE